MQRLSSCRCRRWGTMRCPIVREALEMDWVPARCSRSTYPPMRRRSSGQYFNYRKTTIYAGSTEIQKNIIAQDDPGTVRTSGRGLQLHRRATGDCRRRCSASSRATTISKAPARWPPRRWVFRRSLGTVCRTRLAGAALPGGVRRPGRQWRRRHGGHGAWWGGDCCWSLISAPSCYAAGCSRRRGRMRSSRRLLPRIAARRAQARAGRL